MLRHAWAPLAILLITTPGCAKETLKQNLCIQFDLQATGAEQIFQDRLSNYYGLPFYRRESASGKTYFNFRPIQQEEITEETVAALNAAIQEHIELTTRRKIFANQNKCDLSSSDFAYDQTYEAIKNFQRLVAHVVLEHPERFDLQTVEDYRQAYQNQPSQITQTENPDLHVA